MSTTRGLNVQDLFILVPLEQMKKDDWWYWITDLGFMSVIPYGVKMTSLKLLK